MHKQNLAKSMEGIAKMKAHGCLLLNPFDNGEWEDFRKEFEPILSPGWNSEAYSKAMLMKYVFLKGSESVGVNCRILVASGREQGGPHTPRHPYGVGG